MKNRPVVLLSLLILSPLALIVGCSKPATEVTAPPAPHKHEHIPPHGGTPVELGEDAYHLELVLDATAGKLQAFVFDGELENFIRSAAPSFEISATVGGQPQPLVFKPIANPATGETVGDTSLFEAQAEWLKTTKEFDGVLKTLTIRGTTFTEVKFSFPKGNDKG